MRRGGRRHLSRAGVVAGTGGPAILPSDMACILDYCDAHLPGKDPAQVSTDFDGMKGNLFPIHNRDRLHEYFTPYPD